MTDPPDATPTLDEPDDGEDVAAPRLALDALRAWFAAHVPDAAAPASVARFARGYSNVTLLLRAEDGREYVLRRPPPGVAIASAHDMGREHAILTGLARVWRRAPRPVAYCADAAVIGAPFVVMERVRGVIVRADPPPGLDAAPAAMRRMSEGLIDTLAELHALDADAAGLATLGRPAGFLERQVRGWGRRYRDARSDEVPAIERAARWLEAHLPREDRGAIVHNDYKHDNVVLDAHDPGVVRAVLDWEMATLGDPRADLGLTLAYWVEPGDPAAWRALRFGPTDLPGNLTRAEVLARWAAATGRDPEPALYFYVFGLFKLAAICQQLYARALRGVSDDARLPAMRARVAQCGAAIDRALDTGGVAPV